MSVSRRSVLSGALATPLLAHTATEAVADTSAATLTGGNGWIEILWTSEAQTEMGRAGTIVEPIAPATVIERNGRRGLRFPLRSIQGDPSLSDPAHAQGTAVADGGFVWRNESAEVRITRLSGVVRDERLSGRYQVNDVDAGMQPMFTWSAAEGEFTVVPGLLGQPSATKISDLPARMTPEMLDLMTATARSYDLSNLSTDTVMAHITAQVRFSPL